SLSIALLLFVASVNAGALLARSMHDEIRGQTLPPLLMLPTPSNGIVYSKYLSSLLGWFPGPLVGSLMLLTTEYIRKESVDILVQFISYQWPQMRPGELAELLTTLIALGLYGLFFVLIPHLAALLALYVRW